MWRDGQGRPHLSADEARAGKIVLRTQESRAIFIGGLIGALVLGCALMFAA